MAFWAKHPTYLSSVGTIFPFFSNLSVFHNFPLPYNFVLWMCKDQLCKHYFPCNNLRSGLVRAFRLFSLLTPSACTPWTRVYVLLSLQFVLALQNILYKLDPSTAFRSPLYYPESPELVPLWRMERNLARFLGTTIRIGIGSSLIQIFRKKLAYGS